MRPCCQPRDPPILGAGGWWTNPKGVGLNVSYPWADDGQTGLRPESCWNDCLTRRKLIGLCVPSHIAYEVGAARQQTVRSPRTMDPHSQEWHRNREATVYLPA